MGLPTEAALFLWFGDGRDGSAMIALVDHQRRPIMRFWQGRIMTRPAAAFDANGCGPFLALLCHGQPQGRDALPLFPRSIGKK